MAPPFLLVSPLSRSSLFFFPGPLLCPVFPPRQGLFFFFLLCCSNSNIGLFSFCFVFPWRVSARGRFMSRPTTPPTPIFGISFQRTSPLRDGPPLSALFPPYVSFFLSNFFGFFPGLIDFSQSTFFFPLGLSTFLPAWSFPAKTQTLSGRIQASTKSFFFFFFIYSAFQPFPTAGLSYFRTRRIPLCFCSRGAFFFQLFVFR